METAPEIPKCFGVFPPKVATYLIALFGLGCGGCGLTGVILYGLVEDSILAVFFQDNPVDEDVKKLVLMTLGLSSFLLLLSNIFLFLGIIFRQDQALLLGAYVIFVLCLILIAGAIGLPLACLFWPEKCILKKVSSTVLVFGYMSVTVFLWIWLYFMCVVFNHLNNIEE